MTEIAFTSVRKPWGWLGNMSPFPVVFKDIEWPTVEHLFQALRYHSDDEARQLIRAQRSPMAAKMEAKRYKQRWIIAPRTEADVENMRMCLKLKLEQHPALRTLLLGTGDSLIVEDVSARPTDSGLFWGAAQDYNEAKWRGQNTLGLLWMELRDQLEKH